MDAPRVVFFGTPEFSAETLEYLLQNKVNVVGVVSKPDKPQGRSKSPQPTAVRLVAEKHGLPLYQPDKVSAPEPSEEIRKLNADLFIVVAYGEIIKQHLLDMPPMGCINVHASLLPKYRGAAPIQRSIIEGEKVTGITIMHMVKQMDAGDIIDTVEVPIEENMTYGELSKALCEAGKSLLLKTIDNIIQGKAARTPQDSTQATHAPKIELEDSEIHWDQPAENIHNLIRGTNPEPGAWCKVQHKDQVKRLRIFNTKLAEGEGISGSILQWGPKKIIIACGKNALEITHLQLEGKKTMTAQELINGIPAGTLSISPT